MTRALADALAKLHQGGPQLAASQFTPAQRRALDEFARRTSAVRKAQKGRGIVYEVLRSEALRLELERLYPGALKPAAVDLPNRARNLANRRSSKASGHGHEHRYLLLKAISTDCTWHSARKGTLPLGETCAIAGAGVIATTPEDDWQTSQPIWLVENQALFDRIDWLPAQARGSLLYYSGTLSESFLNWLARRARAPILYYFADYDGAGLLNYVKLLEASTVPVEFWLMPDWSDLLERYGNAAVWQQTQTQYKAACERLRRGQLRWPQEVGELVTALNLQGLALEHEAVWLHQVE